MSVLCNKKQFRPKSPEAQGRLANMLVFLEPGAVKFLWQQCKQKRFYKGMEMYHQHHMTTTKYSELINSEGKAWRFQSNGVDALLWASRGNGVSRKSELLTSWAGSRQEKMALPYLLRLCFQWAKWSRESPPYTRALWGTPASSKHSKRTLQTSTLRRHTLWGGL